MKNYYSYISRKAHIPNVVVILILTVFFLSNSKDFNNEVNFVVDSSEYQILGVNFYKTNQLNLMGFYGDISDYKFDFRLYDDEVLPTSKLFFEIPVYFKDNKYYFRDPGYPFFIGCVYKLFGVNPIAVKIIQVLLLFMSIMILPLIYKNFFGQKGRSLAISASVILFLISFNYTQLFLSETLQIFLMTLSLYFFSRKSLFNLAIACLVFSLIILIKATVYPLVPFMCLFILLKLFKNEIDLKSTLLLYLIIFLLPFIWTIAANKNYASSMDEYTTSYKNLMSEEDTAVYEYIKNSKLPDYTKSLIIENELNLNNSPQVPEQSLYFGFLELVKFSSGPFFVSKRLNYSFLDCNNEYLFKSSFIDWRLNENSAYNIMIQSGESRQFVLLYKFIIQHPLYFLKLIGLKVYFLCLKLSTLLFFLSLLFAVHTFKIPFKHLLIIPLIMLLEHLTLNHFSFNILLFLSSTFALIYLFKTRKYLNPYFKNIFLSGFLFSLLFFSFALFPVDRIILTYVFFIIPIALEPIINERLYSR